MPPPNKQKTLRQQYRVNFDLGRQSILNPSGTCCHWQQFTFCQPPNFQGTSINYSKKN